MKKILIMLAFVGALLVPGNAVFAATPARLDSARQAEIDRLMDFAFKTVFPQQGPGGGAMFVLLAENLKRSYGYENIFFRVHEGGNRFYVTMFRKEIFPQRGGGKAVLSMKLADGGSIVSNSDEFGPPDGKPDRVVFNAWRISAEGEILEETPESFIDLVPGTELYEKYLALFDEGIAEIKKAYGLK